ncbi:hypothetical protein KSP40_PGU009370 [Platanthera guangdongensis]|uniref:Rhodanase C-terminal domain-containing protein n=1 Tax=Platanthera guangdongensis TaxID=2320717 RepID=A0ABR2LRD9_9ASPA
MVMCCSSAMAISFSLTSPLSRFSLSPSSPLRTSYFSVRISCVASISNGLVLASSSHSVHKGGGGEANGFLEFSVVTFYKFVSIEDTEGEVAKHHAFLKDLLSGVDKENTDILMYCTGGIRCDVYSTILRCNTLGRQRGFQKLFTINGGISHYLMTEGSAEWVGNLFVFDSRLSLSPSTYNSTLTTSIRSQIVSEDERFAKCYICASQLLEFRHRNCANLDCNKLFLSCGNCVEEFRGCCCSDCTQAHRLRPVLPGYKRYQKWHRYRDGNF